MTGRPPGKPAPAFLELRGVALHPAHDRGMRHRQAALSHHLYQVAQTELEPKIPAHAQDDDFAVEVATLEQLRYRLQLAHRRPQPAQHANVVDRSPPFAPEPASLCETAVYSWLDDRRGSGPGSPSDRGLLSESQAAVSTPLRWH